MSKRLKRILDWEVLAKAAEYETTAQAFATQLTGRGHRPMLEIRKARLGNRAGLIGAADLTRH